MKLIDPETIWLLERRMRMGEREIEEMVQKTNPSKIRLTPESIDAVIVKAAHALKDEPGAY